MTYQIDYKLIAEKENCIKNIHVLTSMKNKLSCTYKTPNNENSYSCYFKNLVGHADLESVSTNEKGYTFRECINHFIEKYNEMLDGFILAENKKLQG